MKAFTVVAMLLLGLAATAHAGRQLRQEPVPDAQQPQPAPDASLPAPDAQQQPQAAPQQDAQPPQPAQADAGAGAAANGTQPDKLFLNTKLTIVNSSNATIIVNIGTMELSPGFLIPRTVAPGSSTSAEGWNDLHSADIYCDITFVGEGLQRDTVRVEAGNPKFATPWVTVGGNKFELDEGDSRDASASGHNFRVVRNGDLDAAKDMYVYVL